MSENIYMDQYNRTWAKVVLPLNGKHWLLLSSVNHTPDSCKVGCYYADDHLSKAGIGLRKVTKGERYKYSPQFKEGDRVLVDESWLSSVNVTNHANEWCSPGRIGGTVEKSLTNAISVVVNVPIVVPISKVTKRS